jgi:hypothetical protein
MPISHLSLVNQKMAYAGSIIALLNPSQCNAKTESKLQQQALGEAAVFHLAMAVHFYLRELADHYRIKNLSAINSVEDLAAVLQQADRVSSESCELLSLVQTNGAWLNQLTQYYDQLFKSPEKPKEKKAFGSENLIELVELAEFEDSSSQPITHQLLTSWLDSFRALIIRQRDTSAEY